MEKETNCIEKLYTEGFIKKDYDILFNNDKHEIYPFYAKRNINNIFHILKKLSADGQNESIFIYGSWGYPFEFIEAGILINDNFTMVQQDIYSSISAFVIDGLFMTKRRNVSLFLIYIEDIQLTFIFKSKNIKFTSSQMEMLRNDVCSMDDLKVGLQIAVDNRDITQEEMKIIVENVITYD